MLLVETLPARNADAPRENASGLAAALITATFVIAALGGAAIAGIQALIGA